MHVPTKMVFGAATTATVFTIAVIVLVIGSSLDLTPPELSDTSTLIYVTLQIGLPILAGVLMWQLLSRRDPISLPSTRWRGWGRGIVAAYAVTAIFGAPAVQSESTRRSVSEYKRLKATGSVRVWDSHPYLRTYASVPIVPGVLVTYHEYQLDGLYGFGGFEVSVWYVAGVLSVAAIPVWLS
jgi:hypothetical protein